MSEMNNVICGPVVYGEISKISVGLHLYKTLKANADLELIDLTNDLKVTYGELLASSCRLAEYFGSCGLGPGDVISVCSENSVHFFKPVLAAFFTGITVATINHTYAENELQHALDLAEPKIAFCSKATLSAFQKLEAKRSVQYLRKVLALEDLDVVIKEDGKSFKPIDLDVEETVAAILYSSGTTGLSKGVMITHQNINFKYNHVTDPRYQLLDDNRFVVVPFYHAFGFMLSIISMMDAKSIKFLEKFDEILYLESLEKYQIRAIAVVPPLMVLLAKSPRVSQYKLNLEEIGCGAAPLSKSLAQEVIKRLNIKTVKQAYGLTEATLGVMHSPTGSTRFGSCGQVLSGTCVKIRDTETGKALGPNQLGEICIKGGSIMKGYYRNEEATKATLTSDGWLLTGDVGYYDEDEYFYIVDRLKELIKYKGFQVAPAELEALLLTHPKIADAGVIGYPDERVGEKPMAFVVKKPGAVVDEKEVKDFVKGKVSTAKHLHGGVVFVNAIPKNPTGKILRRELKKLIKINSKL
ncbi:PREDICTED: luciferin 4-monooxygenase-like [Nicrophorus vespilloides]|uniref:Luciferin 4-monooxygenase n=1 Tax=Nicrophorus vespilloides TaxID=110193 RepID=A0ABM1N0X5_NICVS|nr:PREDICTED: luciferin 4-monooxygenase-like [Nicrophorus vespilloides]